MDEPEDAQPTPPRIFLVELPPFIQEPDLGWNFVHCTWPTITISGGGVVTYSPVVLRRIAGRASLELHRWMMNFAVSATREEIAAATGDVHVGILEPAGKDFVLAESLTLVAARPIALSRGPLDGKPGPWYETLTLTFNLFRHEGPPG